MQTKPITSNDSAEKVINFYANMVYRLAFARTGTNYDADEIFQEVFLRYIKNQPTFKNEEHRKAWLIKVTINCSKNLFKSSNKRKNVPLDELLTFETIDDTNLYYELQRLPPKYREVIHLFYYEDMSIKDISNVLNRKNSTVRTQLTRARKMLKNIIRESDDV